MKLFQSFPLLLFLLIACNGLSQEATNTRLDVTQFSEMIKRNPGAPVIDVRTPAEFEKGHLLAALNYDWNGDRFTGQVSGLDKSKPVFVYCQSGARSAAAAAQLRSSGFTEVYEMKGGIIQWRAAGLPETASMTTSGMSRAEFDDRLNTGKTVLVDFYADWCAPCKKMKPYLDEIAVDMKDEVLVLRINADDNISLCREMKIDALPVLQVYKNKKMTWNHSGYVEKTEVVSRLK